MGFVEIFVCFSSSSSSGGLSRGGRCRSYELAPCLSIRYIGWHTHRKLTAEVSPVARWANAGVCFSAVQKNRKSVKIWQSYIEFNGVNFLRQSVHVITIEKKLFFILHVTTSVILSQIVVFAVRLTVIYSDYQYLVARQCFDYSNSLSTPPSRSCPVDRSALVIYSKVPDVPETTIIDDLLLVARLPESCANHLHLPTRDEGRLELYYVQYLSPCIPHV